ncbi:unnamed protein product, partial [Brenthis ino]
MTAATSRRGEDQPWGAVRNRVVVPAEKLDQQAMRRSELLADQDQAGGVDRNRFAVPAEKTDRQGMCRLEPRALPVEMGRRQAPSAC